MLRHGCCCPQEPEHRFPAPVLQYTEQRRHEQRVTELLGSGVAAAVDAGSAALYDAEAALTEMACDGWTSYNDVEGEGLLRVQRRHNG